MKTRLPILLAILGLLVVALCAAAANLTGRPLLGAVVGLALVAYILAISGAYVAAIALAVGFHEFGHYLAGRLVGFRFLALIAGPLGIRREGNRHVTFRVRPARLLGYVSMVPTGDDRLIPRYLGFILGGPVASILYTAVVFALWQASGLPILPTLERPAGIGPTLIAGLVTMVLVGTLMVLPGTLLPFRAKRIGGMPTDMLWIFLLLRGGAPAARLVSLMTVSRLLVSGLPARELPPTVLEEATCLRDGSLEELSAVAARWAWALHHEADLAEEMIERHKEIVAAIGEKLLEPWRSSARIAQADHAIFIHRDAETGAKWLEGVDTAHNPVGHAALRLAEAGLAALKAAPDLPSRLDAAEQAFTDAAARTTISLKWEHDWITALRNGWPNWDKP
ncbi:M50 family peptidase [bacterium]|nr:MAG: M50 family peptidase [bacterium]